MLLPLLVALATAPPLELRVGDRAGYVDQADQAAGAWCITVVYLEPRGPGGVPWVIATLDADPRRLVRAPLEQLQTECKR